jgi:hypothetical protein
VDLKIIRLNLQGNEVAKQCNVIEGNNGEAQREALERSRGNRNPLVELTETISKTLIDSHAVLGDILDALERQSSALEGGLMDSLLGGAGAAAAGRKGKPRRGRGRIRGRAGRVGGSIAKGASAVGRTAAKVVPAAIAGVTALGAGAAKLAPSSVQATASAAKAGVVSGVKATSKAIGSAAEVAGKSAAQVAKSGAIRGVAKALGPAAAIIEAGLVVSDNFDELTETGKISVTPQITKSIEGVKTVFSENAGVIERLGGALDTASGAVGTVAAAGTQIGKVVNDVTPDEWMDEMFTGFGLWGDTIDDVFDQQEEQFQADMVRIRAERAAKEKAVEIARSKADATKKTEEAKTKAAEADLAKVESTKKTEEDAAKKSIAGAAAVVGVASGAKAADALQKGAKEQDPNKAQKIEIDQPKKNPISVNLTDKDGTPWEEKIKTEGTGPMMSPVAPQSAGKIASAQSSISQIVGPRTNPMQSAVSAATSADNSLRLSAPIVSPKIASDVAPKISTKLSGTGVDKGAQIASDLVKSGGLTQAQAAGVVGNMMVETGGFKHHQELSPRAGRGGAGWLQWTGPRRRNFEKWSESQGLDPQSDDANFGFLLHEMEGGTGDHWTKKGMLVGGKRATKNYSLAEFKKIKDPKEAAKYFMEGYERPGILHEDRRTGFGEQIAGMMDPDAAKIATSTQTAPAPQTPKPPTPTRIPAIQPSDSDSDGGVLDTLKSFGASAGDTFESGVANLRGASGASPAHRAASGGTTFRQSTTKRGDVTADIDPATFQRAEPLGIQQAFAEQTVTGGLPSSRKLMDAKNTSALDALSPVTDIGSDTIQQAQTLSNAQDLLTGTMPNAIAPAVEANTLSNIQTTMDSMTPPSLEDMASIVAATSRGNRGGGGTEVTGVPKQSGVQTPLEVRNSESSIRRLTDSLLAYSFG